MMRLLLDLKQTTLDGIIYFKSHTVVDPGKLTTVKKMDIINIQNGPKLYRKILKEILGFKTVKKEDEIEIQDKIRELEEFAVSDIGQDYGIDFYEYN
jgi:DNA-directed RNA polymerase subunit beta'